MRVNFLGAIREITGIPVQSSNASTIRDLLNSLLDTYGIKWKAQVFDGKGLAAGVVVMVNGMNIQQIQGLSTPLCPEDRIDILPMFEGG